MSTGSHNASSKGSVSPLMPATQRHSAVLAEVQRLQDSIATILDGGASRHSAVSVSQARASPHQSYHSPHHSPAPRSPSPQIPTTSLLPLAHIELTAAGSYELAELEQAAAAMGDDAATRRQLDLDVERIVASKFQTDDGFVELHVKNFDVCAVVFFPSCCGMRKITAPFDSYTVSQDAQSFCLEGKGRTVSFCIPSQIQFREFYYSLALVARWRRVFAPPSL